MRKIFLYGPMGSGKSTVGRVLAQRINAEFLDLDKEIEKRSGLTITDIISEQGEAIFRDIESKMLADVCDRGEDLSSETIYGVVALGGGTLLRSQNRALCEEAGEVVYLDVDMPTLVSRLSKDGNQRPLLAGDREAKLAKILQDRKDHYDSFLLRVAIDSLPVDPSGNAVYELPKTPEDIAWEIQQKIGRYHVRGMGRGYDVLVSPGGISQIGKLFRERALTGPVVVVCDENVAQFHAEAVFHSLQAEGFSSTLLVIPAGEDKKTIETVSQLWKGFLSAGVDRKSTVVALGGGVVGDLTGFAAATFMRGCSWVAVPTTLLAMVDASLGGKTGFDLPEGKNLIGAFHSPRLVLSDPNVLSTLPEEEFISGIAEVIKHGIISDPELFEDCAQGTNSIKENIVRIIRKAVGVKVRVIEQDPFEAGIRAALNLGHTVGHAIEIASGFRLRHGEAVAIGMVSEARLAENLGLSNSRISKKIVEVLQKTGLPTEMPLGLDRSTVLRAMKLDKKKEMSVVKFALPIDIGNVRVGVAIDDLEKVI